MIRPLRQVHRWGVPLLLVAVLPALTLALRQRGPAPGSEAAPFAASIRVLPASGTHRQAEVRLPADIPEVLVYWVPVGGAGVDAKAVLVARPAAAGNVIDIPDELHQGELLLYSLPLQQVLTRQTLSDGAQP